MMVQGMVAGKKTEICSLPSPRDRPWMILTALEITGTEERDIPRIESAGGPALDLLTGVAEAIVVIVRRSGGAHIHESDHPLVMEEGSEDE